MEASERDTTDDWRIAPGRAPATVFELEGRIDVALATARTAEEAALEIGAASLEAAEQARRAAALAESASALAARAAGEVAAAPLRSASEATPGADPPQEDSLGAGVTPESASVVDASAAGEAPPAPSAKAPPRLPSPRPDPFDERITAFRQRAEKVMIRLQRIESGRPLSGHSEAVRLG